jgi:hypothetical protein
MSEAFLNFSDALIWHMQNVPGAEDAIRGHAGFWDDFPIHVWRAMLGDRIPFEMPTRVYQACILWACAHLMDHDEFDAAISALVPPHAYCGNWVVPMFPDLPPPIRDCANGDCALCRSAHTRCDSEGVSAV